MLPVAFCAMGSHCASVFALSAGAVSFAQIVKSAEPVFSAILSQFVYGKKISRAKWMCLPIVVGGVILASVKELDFAWSALIAACIGNLFAAFKGNENKKLMEVRCAKRNKRAYWKTRNIYEPNTKLTILTFFGSLARLPPPPPLLH